MTEAHQSTLAALRSVGTVRGVCLFRGGEILENLFPFSLSRMQALCEEADSILNEFSARSRDIDRLVIGFDGGHLIILAEGGLRLLLMHMIPDEADFVAKAGKAFLSDYVRATGTKDEADEAPMRLLVPPAKSPLPNQSSSIPEVPATQAQVPAPAPVPTRPAMRAKQPAALVKEKIAGAVVVQPARLAVHQPLSTLPPQKKPRLRSRRES